MKKAITVDEGFCAMVKFLEKWYAFTKSDDIAFILTSKAFMSLVDQSIIFEKIAPEHIEKIKNVLTIPFFI